MKALYCQLLECCSELGYALSSLLCQDSTSEDALESCSPFHWQLSVIHGHPLPWAHRCSLLPLLHMQLAPSVSALPARAKVSVPQFPTLREGSGTGCIKGSPLGTREEDPGVQEAAETQCSGGASVPEPVGLQRERDGREKEVVSIVWFKWPGRVPLHQSETQRKAFGVRRFK